MGVSPAKKNVQIIIVQPDEFSQSEHIYVITTQIKSENINNISVAPCMLRHSYCPPPPPKVTILLTSNTID